MQKTYKLMTKFSDDDMKTIYNSLETVLIQNNNNATDLVKSTYGEILFTSVEKLIETLDINQTDRFYDLGSGYGKVVMQFYMNTDVQMAFGIEYHPERNYVAEKALKKLYLLFPSVLKNDRIISYINGNIKDLYYLDDATIVFMCSTCYPTELMSIVHTKLSTNKKLKYIITHKQHDDYKKLLPNIRKMNLPCTWSESIEWFIYYK